MFQSRSHPGIASVKAYNLPVYVLIADVMGCIAVGSFCGITDRGSKNLALRTPSGRHMGLPPRNEGNIGG